MPVPWTGLHNLLDPESVITWEDLADIVMIVRKIARSDDGLLWECLLGHHHVNHAAYAAMDTVPSAKAVGRVLTRALNGMLIEGGWGQELGSLEAGDPVWHLCADQEVASRSTRRKANTF